MEQKYNIEIKMLLLKLEFRSENRLNREKRTPKYTAQMNSTKLVKNSTNEHGMNGNEITHIDLKSKL